MGNRYEVAIGITPICTCCGNPLEIGYTKQTDAGPNPYVLTERSVFISACTRCFVWKEPGTSWVDRAAEAAQSIITDLLSDVEPERMRSGNDVRHLRWMADQLAGKTFSSETKACRWLGYLQASLVLFGRSTLEAEKARNLRSGREESSADH